MGGNGRAIIAVAAVDFVDLGFSILRSKKCVGAAPVQILTRGTRSTVRDNACPCRPDTESCECH